MELFLANEEFGDFGKSREAMTHSESLCGREEVCAFRGFPQLKRGNGARYESALGFAERDIF